MGPVCCRRKPMKGATVFFASASAFRQKPLFRRVYEPKALRL